MLGPSLSRTHGLRFEFQGKERRNITKPWRNRVPTASTSDPGPGSFAGYLEGHGDLVSKLVTPITHIATLVIPLTNLLTKSP